MYVAAGATAAVIVLSWFHRPSAIGPRRFVECCTDTITQLVPLVGAVAAAGVVIGAIEISALAGKFTLLINMVSGGLLVPTLLLSALFLILLGMGMPTPAVYIMGAALLAPVLRGVFNLPEMQVHLFMLYFACLSAITPPVAVANFAAGAIAGVNPMALGPYAVKLAIGGFILPFYFLFNPGLNMQGSLLYIVECIFFAVAMVTFASLAMQGFMGLRSISWPLRLVLFACAVATVSPRFDITLGGSAARRRGARLSCIFAAAQRRSTFPPERITPTRGFSQANFLCRAAKAKRAGRLDHDLHALPQPEHRRAAAPRRSRSASRSRSAARGGR